jgi:cell wall-associated NlpC family hydrolase
LLLISCSPAVRYSSITEKTIPKEAKPSDFRKAIINEVKNYIGTPYKKEEMDCSYFTMVVFKNAIGLNLPRTTSEQFKLGRLITNPDSLEIGDLLFFNTTGEIASHVGIYIGDGFFAHASVSEGVTISSINDPYYRKRFNGAKRIIESK